MRDKGHLSFYPYSVDLCTIAFFIALLLRNREFMQWLWAVGTSVHPYIRTSARVLVYLKSLVLLQPNNAFPPDSELGLIR